jgi:hypothetical protein
MSEAYEAIAEELIDLADMRDHSEPGFWARLEHMIAGTVKDDELDAEAEAALRDRIEWLINNPYTECPRCRGERCYDVDSWERFEGRYRRGTDTVPCKHCDGDGRVLRGRTWYAGMRRE